MTCMNGMTAGDRRGFVLATVLGLTLLVWALLAGLLSLALLQHRLAVAAQRSAAATAAAEQAVATGLAWARAEHAATGSWPSAPPLSDVGRCELSLAEVAAAEGWWRLGVHGRFENVEVHREGTVRLP